MFDFDILIYRHEGSIRVRPATKMGEKVCVNILKSPGSGQAGVPGSILYKDVSDVLVRRLMKSARQTHNLDVALIEIEDDHAALNARHMALKALKSELEEEISAVFIPKLTSLEEVDDRRGITELFYQMPSSVNKTLIFSSLRERYRHIFTEGVTMDNWWKVER